MTDSGANQEPGSFYDDRPHHVVAFDVAPFERRSRTSACSPRSSPASRTGSRSTPRDASTCPPFSGVQVFDPSGDPLGEIELPGAVNFAFGGPSRNVLFITADDAVWAAELNAKGA